MTLDPKTIMLSSSNLNSGYFTEFTCRKALFYVFVGIYVISVSLLALLEPFLNLACDVDRAQLEFSNPVYDANPCRQSRYAILLGFTPEECSYARRLVASIFLGGIIGWERRQADRPAGIRTMALVSLGSCVFTINSASGFLNGPMSWDASRVSAAIPSGVGFLGAGLIFKKEEKTKEGDFSHVVHGLTTAASLWLSAAVGISCGGELYMVSAFSTGLILLLLRFGPRQREESGEEDSVVHNDMERVDMERGFATPQIENYDAIPHTVIQDENASLARSVRSVRSTRSSKLKQRASFATMS